MQQNAALVEESAAAAESLQGQAVALAEVVGKFVLNQRMATGAIVGPVPPSHRLTSACGAPR